MNPLTFFGERRRFRNKLYVNIEEGGGVKWMLLGDYMICYFCRKLNETFRTFGKKFGRYCNHCNMKQPTGWKGKDE